MHFDKWKLELKERIHAVSEAHFFCLFLHNLVLSKIIFSKILCDEQRFFMLHLFIKMMIDMNYYSLRIFSDE